MTKISDKSYELAKAKFAEAFQMLGRVIQSEVSQDSQENGSFSEELSDNESFVQELSESDEWQKQEELCIKQCIKLKDELDAYCRQLPCISLNGSKYDLNLIKK